MRTGTHDSAPNRRVLPKYTRGYRQFLRFASDKHRVSVFSISPLVTHRTTDRVVASSYSGLRKGHSCYTINLRICIYYGIERFGRCVKLNLIVMAVPTLHRLPESAPASNGTDESKEKRSSSPPPLLAGSSTVSLFEQERAETDFSTEDERRLVRKLDIRVFPVLFVVFMMSFLDRINISNARIQGLTEELDLSGNRFNIALFVSRIISIVHIICLHQSALRLTRLYLQVYFIPYILLEVPSNMIIRKARPS